VSKKHTHPLDIIGERPEPLMEVQSSLLQAAGRCAHVATSGPIWVPTRPDRHLLVIGPPRSGKTSSVIIPAVLCAPGPVVTTSTQLDVFQATALSRSLGVSPANRLWVYDPTGTEETPPGAEELRWSPVGRAAMTWDGALAIARAMVKAAPRDDHDSKGVMFWSERAGALLAAFLHAAALEGMSMREVMTFWVLGLEGERVLEILGKHGALMARATLRGLLKTHHETLSNIYASAASAVAAYATDAALATCDSPNFDADRFVRSYRASQEFVDAKGRRLVPNLQGTMRAADTLYIVAQGEHQHLAAPLVVGLLTEIRQAAYAFHRERARSKTTTAEPPVLFALDELAHIAPMDDLPAMLAEGGSRGVLIIGCMQDLSQARARWGARADGFLTLFGDKLILPGIADAATMSVLSDIAGEYDRTVRTFGYTYSTNRSMNPFAPGAGITQGWNYQDSIQRERVLPQSAIYQGPDRRHGDAYLLQGGGFLPVFLTPYYSTSPWPQLLVRSTEHAAMRVNTRNRWWNWSPRAQPHLLLPTPPLHGGTLSELGGRQLVDRWHRALTTRKESSWTRNF
jgi:type IV secretion system protein VirD4